MTSETDEDRWVEAQSLLDSRPSEEAAQRLSRWRRSRLLFMVGLSVAGAALGLVVVLLAGGGGSITDLDPPVWQEVTGVVVSGVGCVLALIGLVAILKANRRLRAWHNPLAPLTRQQRKQLVAQVRGRAPVQPERLPLARYTAELLVNQRLAWVTQFTLLILWAGMWIADPTWWRLAAATAFALLALVGGFFVRRDADRAQHFLDSWPAPEESVA
jgi:hypothetical protein